MAKEKNDKRTTTVYFAPKIKDGVAKETKGTVVFEECNQDGSEKDYDVVVGQLYVQKGFLKADRPKMLTVTVEY